MKKVLVWALCALLAFSSITALAAGKDDGAVNVEAINGQKYFKMEKAEYCTYYFASNGLGDNFYRYGTVDVNGDKEMDVCDLVHIKKELCKSKVDDSMDITFDGKFTASDLIVLRKVLLGITDIKEVKLNEK